MAITTSVGTSFNVGIGRGRPSRGGRSRCANRSRAARTARAISSLRCSDAGPTPLVCVWRANWVSGRSRRAPEAQPARCAVPGAWPHGRRMPRPSRSAPDARRHDCTRRLPRVAPALAPPTEPSRAPDRAPAEARPPLKRSQPALAPTQGRTTHGRTIALLTVCQASRRSPPARPCQPWTRRGRARPAHGAATRHRRAAPARSAWISRRI